MSNEFKTVPTALRRLANELRGYASIEGVARALDGLANDIETAPDHAGKVVANVIRAENGTVYLEWANNKTIMDFIGQKLYTTPQASVIDEAMVKRACNAYDNQLDNILYLESLAIYPAMHAALKAALEQTK